MESNALFLIALLAIPFGAAIGAFFCPRSLLKSLHIILTAIITSVFALLSWKVPEIAGGDAPRFSVQWLPALNVPFSLSLDGLSLLFALMITGIGSLILFYSGGYHEKNRELLPSFYFFILVFMGSMLGVVLAGDLITLFIFWEMTTISSFFLIGFRNHRSESRQAAVQGLFVTSGMGLALLAGFLLIGQTLGSFELSQILSKGVMLKASSAYWPIVFLVIAGAVAKSAQAPLHFWLPSAMAAPTPVSAYLHSATMVKAGVYLLMRLSPALGETSVWQITLLVIGVGTVATGAILAFLQVDLKRILAYLTLLSLGMMVILIGVGTHEAIKAALVLLLAHSLYKGALFLVGGTLEHQAGTRNLEELHGRCRAMKLTAAAALISALSMGGVPPLKGFLSKELTFEALLSFEGALAIVVLGKIITAACAARLFATPFLARGPQSHLPQAKEGAFSLWFPALLLSFLSIGFGAFPGLWDSTILSPALAALELRATPVNLKLWHGFSPQLILSLTSVVLGFALYWFYDRVRPGLGWILEITKWFGAENAYSHFIEGLKRFSVWQTRVVQNGSTRLYLISIVLFFTCFITTTQAKLWQISLPQGWLSIRYYEWILAALVIMGSLGAVLTRWPLVAFASLGASGYGISLIFVIFGAPDLALTQFLIETLVIILVVLIFILLPRQAIGSGTRASKLFDILISSAFGVVFTFLLWETLSTPPDVHLEEYFNRQSVPLAHGRNIVNTILVDFRALDTLGEIIVVSLAALGVLGLMKRPAGGENE